MFRSMDTNDVVTLLMFAGYAAMIGGLAIRHGLKTRARQD